jgi:hypothetical protein
MARMSYPRSGEPLPAPLPPERRTIGQLVAETIKLYGERFWAALPLGASVGVLDAVAFGHSVTVQTLLLWAFAPLLTGAYVRAATIVVEEQPSRRALATAFVAGLLVFLPFPVLVRLYVLPGIAWFALFGLAVPAAVAEGIGLRAALRRGFALGRVDYRHALGGIFTLALVYILSRYALLLLLQTQSDQTQRIAGFLADLVLAPVVFLGAALLYVDQAARAERATIRT